VFRVPKAEGLETLRRLWLREMPTGVYDPKWLRCGTAEGPVRALAFTLSRRSPNFTGELTDERYRHIFANAVGRYGTSLDYARQTLLELQRHSIHDAALARLVALVAVQEQQRQQLGEATADCDAPQPPVYVPGSAGASSSDPSSSPPCGPSKENK
jgi:cation transport protein ChaC